MQIFHDALFLPAAITLSGSKQTYYTIRLFVDRELINDAYRAYAYFRWLDDIIDAGYEFNNGGSFEMNSFVKRQRELLEAFYQGESRDDLCIEEQMLSDLVQNDDGDHSGLQTYLRNMMTVMEFDMERRGRMISQAELTQYSYVLATAIMGAMDYFIGHKEPAPSQDGRFLAVIAAHIAHMLRDTLEDVENGYFNISSEYLQMNGISPLDVDSAAFRDWVCTRVKMARRYFEEGRKYILQVSNLRRRLAGYAYSARFEWMLRTIERDNYRLRYEYRERKSLFASLWMSWTTLMSMLGSLWTSARFCKMSFQPDRIGEQ